MVLVYTWKGERGTRSMVVTSTREAEGMVDPKLCSKWEVRRTVEQI